MTTRFWGGAIILIALWSFSQAGQAQDKKEKSPEEGKKGVTVGMLEEVNADKGFILVKADGEEKARRFVPQWKGVAAQGGGYDKDVVKVFRSLKAGSRIEVDWVFEERLRALKVKVLKPAPEKTEK